MPTYKGECFCGAVKMEVTGEPEVMGYCHCRSCRSWSGAPVNAFSLWKPEAVKATAGAEHVATFAKTPTSESTGQVHLGRMLLLGCGDEGLTETGVGRYDPAAIIVRLACNGELEASELFPQ